MKSLLETEDGDTIDINFEELYDLCDNDVPCHLANDTLDPDTDFLQSTWNSNVIEDSLETIRNVLATANIPDNNRDIIEKSLTTLRNAIDLPGETAVNNTGYHDSIEQHESSADLVQDDWTAVTEDDTKCYAAVTPAAAEHEDRVREALGISTLVSAKYLIGLFCIVKLLSFKGQLTIFISIFGSIQKNLAISIRLQNSIKHFP